ncbi:L-lactate permease [Saccharopolyspora sp. CA-218241]|uniref:L-lactate permease n=1 Tax=Saccharopolyspora sp. CA-218241 TaxID=3240027 RepID=UPI003D95D89F
MELHAGIWMWVVSVVPLALLLFLMVLRRWGAAESGVLGWLATALIALFVFRLPVEAVGMETVKGVVESVTIVYIVLAAILIYEVANHAQAFDPFQRGMTRIFSHPLLQVMVIGWVFAGFLQGITGFGVPVAVCAPLLVGLGVRPAYAVVVALLGQAWNNTFGTLGAAWLGLEQVTSLSAAQKGATALQTSMLLAVLTVAGGLTMCWLYGKWRGLWEGLPAVVVISLAQAGVTLALAQWNPTLNGFAGGLLALVIVPALAKLPMYRRPTRVSNSPMFQQGSGTSRSDGGVPESSAPGPGGMREEGPPTAVRGQAATMTLNTAFIPYYTLLAVTITVLMVPPLTDVLSKPTITLDFPAVMTGLGFETASSSEQFVFLTHAGTLLLITAAISYFAYRRKGYLAYGAWRGILSNTVEKSIAPTIAVITLVGMAAVMQASGQANVLATQVAAWTGGVYVLLAPFIGVFGSFITGSNMSSNLLFGSFQETTANAAHLSTSGVLSAQTAGAATGTVMSPSKILLGTTTAGIAGQEGQVLRRTLPFTLVVTVILGLATLAFLV